MHSRPGYILLLMKQPQVLGILADLLKQGSHAVAIARSEDQALARARLNPPVLIIVAGDQRNWSSNLGELRRYANTRQILLVALTDTHSPSWIYQEDNPGFDGFLVNPISSDILSSLVHSAQARQRGYALG